MNCHICGSTNFRRSRFTSSDLSELFQLRYPVRCRNCHERVFAGILPALGLPKPKYVVDRMPEHALEPKASAEGKA